jgi:hypothetical protein
MKGRDEGDFFGLRGLGGRGSCWCRLHERGWRPLPGMFSDSRADEDTIGGGVGLVGYSCCLSSSLNHRDGVTCVRDVCLIM